MILGVPSAVSRTLAGLRSRWRMPCSWAACIARASVSTELGRLARRLRLAAELAVEAAAVDEFQREERQPVLFADFVDLDDVRMLEPGDRLGFDIEAGQLMIARMGAGQHHLERDEAVEPALTCLVNDAHAAPAQLAEDFVAGHHGRIPVRTLFDRIRDGKAELFGGGYSPADGIEIDCGPRVKGRRARHDEPGVRGIGQFRARQRRS